MQQPHVRVEGMIYLNVINLFPTEITFRFYVSFVTSPRLRNLIWTDTGNEDQYSEWFWVKSVKIPLSVSKSSMQAVDIFRFSFFKCKVYSTSRFLYKNPQFAESLELESGGSDLPVRRWGHLISSIEKVFVCQLCTPDVLTSLPQSCRSSAREIFHQSAACSFTSASSCQSLPE